MSTPFSRRTLLTAGASLGAAALISSPTAAAEGKPQSPFRYCFNTATIMGQKLPLNEEVDVAAKAGYQGFEPWVRKIEEHVKAGGSLADTRKRIADAGLTVESAIGFPDWINDDDAKRAAGLEQMKRDMDLVAQIGGKRIAAPPIGGYNAPLDPYKVAERYRKVCDLGRQTGVVPQVELWGGSKTLSRLGEVALVLVESADPDACAVLDVFHIYRGGSDFGGLQYFSGRNLHVFHINDYPASPPRAEAKDSQRVYPGDGVAPLTQILRHLASTGAKLALSLELFNPEYYKQDPLAVAKTGLEKIRNLVEKAMAG